MKFTCPYCNWPRTKTVEYVTPEGETLFVCHNCLRINSHQSYRDPFILHPLELKEYPLECQLMLSLELLAILEFKQKIRKEAQRN